MKRQDPLRGIVAALLAICALNVVSFRTKGLVRRSKMPLRVTQLPPFNNPFNGDVAAETHPRTQERSELPDSFEDAVNRAVEKSMKCIENGSSRIRIDFDTTIGDATYTSLQNTMPMIKEMTHCLAREFDLEDPLKEVPVSPFDMSPEDVEATPTTSVSTSPPAAPAAADLSSRPARPPPLVVTKPKSQMTQEELEALADAEFALANEIDSTLPSNAQSRVEGTNVVIGSNDPAAFRPSAGPSEEQMAALEAEEGMQKPDGPVGLLSTEQLKEFRSLSREQLAEVQKDNRLGRSAKGSLRLYFPDMGAAALARRDWKMGTKDAEVPLCIATANIQNDGMQKTDKAAVLVCPLHYETDFVQRVVRQCDELGVPVIMVNPDLISMDQGFGVRARNLRKDLLNTFVTTYKLKTLPTGAVVREWPSGYSVWNEDAEAEDGSGYVHLDSFTRDPTREMLDDLFDEANGDAESQKPPNSAELIANELSGFFKGLSRL